MATQRKFSVAVKLFVDKAKRECEARPRKIIDEVYTRIIRRSPVDKGLFMGNWQASIGAPATGVLARFDKRGNSTVSAMRSVIRSVEMGRVTYLINNLPYARRLEYGWSKQAPDGMVRRTLAEYDIIVANATKQGSDGETL